MVGRILQAVLVACLLGVASCGGGAYTSGAPVRLEKVTTILLDNTRPAPGGTVKAVAFYDCNMGYPLANGFGPKFTWRVSAGELSGRDYDMELHDFVVRRGQELVRIESSHVEWRLPETAEPLWISAEMSSGGTRLFLTPVAAAPEP